MAQAHIDAAEALLARHRKGDDALGRALTCVSIHAEHYARETGIRDSLIPGIDHRTVAAIVAAG